MACPVIAGEPPIEEAGAKEMRTPKIRCGAYIRCMLIERMRKRLGDSLREAILAHSQGDDQALQ